ncbi:MAG: hypothetical protein KKA67_12355, partial [Spirochaetes bacterium]|nr:hypothetical protein [Spirochaetota bacterium]
AGLPCLAYGVLATAIAGVGLSAWLPWSAGDEAARLTAYSATEEASMCAVRLRAAGGLSTERNVSLGAGDIVLEFDIAEIRGPFSLALGSRRYRPSAVEAGGTRVALHGAGPSIIGPGRAGSGVSAGDVAAALIGCSVSTLAAPPFEPSALATATYVMSRDGAIELTAR